MRRGGHINALGGLASREVNVPFSAGNFSATGAMTWTVAAPGIATFRYSIQGRLMSVWLNITQGASSVVGGVVAGNNLLVTIPEAKVPAFATGAVVIGVPNGLPIESVALSLSVGVAQMTILRYNANWVAGPTGINICGVTFEFQ